MSESFVAAYDALLARWPAGTAALTVATPYGPTRVHAYGPPDAPPLVLLPGGGATGAAWFANAPALGARHRVYAVDILGDVGRSERAGLPLRTPSDLMAWLDAVLDGLELPSAALCGHSYGGWVAAAYALHAPRRVERLALLDPTQVFGGYRPGYLLRVLPMLLRPTARRVGAYLAWETAGTGVDEDFGRLYVRGATLPGRGRPVVGRTLDPAPLAPPVLVVFAGRSRVHDAAATADRARRLLPRARVEVLPGVGHHALPTAASAAVDALVLEFLGTPPARRQAALGSSL
ncbi:alpha/beta fold hydrolase [Kitasatospora paracochleata]|uniref:Pimeloyl-ACP methyl ester carboxylesterase n=1 Tax=Kitasatospora paracochleata TaxID=58354 RepID=A0ABT1ITK0_9ACTN|nr:alpha/beta fold hydrolase [Kitasatospora paracochleata]MCP2308466.1 pimeloyl-ACP methyl ester carboxylesterase [Kitasatospora paracochleata]